MNGPMLCSACPGHRPIMDDSPVINLHDVLIAEIPSGRCSGLVKRHQGSHNCFPQLVFHERSPVGRASGDIMNTNCFFPKGFSPLPNKTPKSAARYTLRRVTHNVLTLRVSKGDDLISPTAPSLFQ